MAKAHSDGNTTDKRTGRTGRTRPTIEAAVVDAAGDTVDEDVVDAPAGGAPKAEWVAYAVYLGADPDAEELTVAEIKEWVAGQLGAE